MNRNLIKWLNERAPVGEVEITDPVLTIGAAAKHTGLSESALRKYGTSGLIIFYRTDTNRRMLSLEDLERIGLIQNLIKNKGLNLEGILRLWTLIPCWELKGCSEMDRKDCAATKDSERPCWVLFESQGCPVKQSCRTCEVYRFSAYSTEDIKSLVHSILMDDQNNQHKQIITD